ncbi:MAG: ATP-binding cassette domain-containing protein, partial [Desulfobacterales bacterium]|nr:ATP-binding cassette domain-containing protein [Desulfobacterales bacterium]
MSQPILASEQLTKHYSLKTAGFSRRSGVVRAVEDVSLTVLSGEVFGLVGESGCGKSTLGRVLLRLEDPTAGKVFFAGQNLGA